MFPGRIPNTTHMSVEHIFCGAFIWFFSIFLTPAAPMQAPVNPEPPGPYPGKPRLTSSSGRICGGVGRVKWLQMGYLDV